MSGKPLRNNASGGRETASLAGAEKKPADGQRQEAARQCMAGTGERPEHHDEDETPARAQQIDQPSTARIHQRIGKQKSRLKHGELLVGEWNVLADGLDGNRQGLAVKVADGDRGTDQDRDAPAQRGGLRS